MARNNIRKERGIPIEGQLTLWDIEITEKPSSFTKTEKKESKLNDSFTTLSPVIIKKETEKPQKCIELTSEQQDFLDKNKIFENENLNRVIKYCGGGVGVELLQGSTINTIYVNKEGKQEYTFDKKIPVLPMDKILYYKTAVTEFNSKQQERLTDLLREVPNGKVIKRKGDENILVDVQDMVISINSAGWVLEFDGCKAIYTEDEVEYKEPVNIETLQQSVKIGDIVEASYGDRVITGEICSVYGSGNVTLNIIFDNGKKHTAICRKCVKSLIKSA